MNWWRRPNKLSIWSSRMAQVLIVNWLGKGHHPLSGDEAVEGFVSVLDTALQADRPKAQTALPHGSSATGIDARVYCRRLASCPTAWSISGSDLALAMRSASTPSAS